MSAIESRLSQMVNLNRTRIDYLEKFQKMIDEYNSGACDKDAFFENLMKFIKDLKRCIAHSYLERSHLGLFFKLFYRTFAKCPEKIGDIESLYRELASHGYVVCSIDHVYHSLYSAGVDGKVIRIDRDYLSDLKAEDAKSDREQSFRYYKEWMKLRCDDIDFVIDYILDQTLKNEAGGVYELVDANRIGLAGHSLGGAAVLGTGRNRKDIDGVIALEAPFLCDIKGVEDGEFIWENESYPVPLLNIYSDSSWNNLGNWPQYAANNKLLFSNRPDIFNIYIEGTGHLGLTDLSLVSPFLTNILDGKSQTLDSEHSLQRINRACLEFFDYYLKGEEILLQK